MYAAIESACCRTSCDVLSTSPLTCVYAPLQHAIAVLSSGSLSLGFVPSLFPSSSNQSQSMATPPCAWFFWRFHPVKRDIFLITISECLLVASLVGIFCQALLGLYLNVEMVNSTSPRSQLVTFTRFPENLTSNLYLILKATGIQTGLRFVVAAPVFELLHSQAQVPMLPTCPAGWRRYPITLLQPRGENHFDAERIAANDECGIIMGI